MSIPKHLMESKLITDEQWEEYLKLKEENKHLENEVRHLKQQNQIMSEISGANIEEFADKLNEVVKERDRLYDEVKTLTKGAKETLDYMQNKYDNSDLCGFTISFNEFEELKRKLRGKNE